MKKAWKWLLGVVTVIVLSLAFVVGDAFRRAVNAIELQEDLLRKDVATLRQKARPVPLLPQPPLSFEELSKLPCPANEHLNPEPRLEEGHRSTTVSRWGIFHHWIDSFSQREEDLLRHLNKWYALDQYLAALAVTLDTYRPGGFGAHEARHSFETAILNDLSLVLAGPNVRADERKTVLEKLDQLLAARAPVDEFIAGEFLLDRAEVLKVIPTQGDPTVMMNRGPEWREGYSWRILVAKSLNQLSDDYDGIREPDPYEIPRPATGFGMLQAADSRILTRSRLKSDARSVILSDRRALTYWHAARLVAALLLFREEKGREPKDLAELAPAYLPKIPVCPYGGMPYLWSEGQLIAPQADLSFRLTR